MPAFDASKDYYAVLGLLSPWASQATSTFTIGAGEVAAEAVKQKDITAAYRKLSLMLHPDRPGGNTEKFKQIQEAYEVLNDEARRREYDVLRAQAAARAYSQPSGYGYGPWNRAGAGTGPSRGGMDSQRQESKTKKTTQASEEPKTKKRPGPRTWQRYGDEKSHFPTPPTGETPTAQGPNIVEPTPDLPEAFSFSAFPFEQYYDIRSHETNFFKHQRKGVADARIKVREAEVSLHCAKSDFKKFGATHIPTMESVRVSEALVVGEERLRWWKNELGRREAWLKGHEAMAKVRKAEEKGRVSREKEAEKERLRAMDEAKEAERERRRAVENERKKVKDKTRVGKVEVVEIEDSDDGNEDAGMKLKSDDDGYTRFMAEVEEYARLA